MTQQKTSAYIMVIIGFIMLALNAIGYLFHLDISSSAMSIMGLVLVAIGARNLRQTKNN